MNTSEVAFDLLFNLQWLFIGMSLVLAWYDLSEYRRLKQARYLSYGAGRIGFSGMVGVIGLLIRNVNAVAVDSYYMAWVACLVLISQSIAMRVWEIRDERKHSG